MSWWRACPWSARNGSSATGSPPTPKPGSPFSTCARPGRTASPTSRRSRAGWPRCHPQALRYWGSRLPTYAARASIASAVALARICCRFSTSIMASKDGISRASHMPCLVSESDIGGAASSASSVASTRSESSVAGPTSVTSPMRSASSAPKRRLVSMSSWALAAPTSRGSSHEVPMSQPVTPMRMNDVANTAVSDARRMSLAQTSASPPPAAGPFTAAITGCGIRRISCTSAAIARCTAQPCWMDPRSSVPGIVPKPPRSRPAQKPRPAPVRTTARHVRSSASAARRACSSATRGAVSAFSLSGRDSVSCTTPGLSSVRSTRSVAGSVIGDPFPSGDICSHYIIGSKGPLMGALDDRVAVITGAGRGLGREHALLFAAEGAKVVVNDLGGGPDGSGSDASPAQQVVEEIRAAGGQAVANSDDVTSAAGADAMIRQAVEEFGALHVLVNNAGILRDRTIINMTDGEWDDVIRVHLRGHFMPLRAAARYWREQSKAGNELRPSLINTTSTSGLYNNPGQAKTGIATLTIIAQHELGRYGVRANAIAPAARTRLTLATPGISEAILHAPEEGFDAMDPGNVSPFVAYLATADCPLRGRVFFVAGGGIHLFQPFAIIDSISKDGRWTVEELATEAARLSDVPFSLGQPSL